MFRVMTLGVSFLLISLTGFCAAGAGTPIHQPAVEQSFGRLPLYFVENQGQIDSDEVAFYVKGADKTLYFTPEGITFALAGNEGGAAAGRWVAKLGFVGANPGVRPEGQEKQKAVFSYFKGKPSDWKTGLPTYTRLIYRDLWPGIDLVYSGTVNELKYEFVVAPGADPSQIQLAYEGVTALSVNETGELKVETGVCSFQDGRPVAYQETDGARHEVPVGYAPGESAAEAASSYGFDLGAFDPKRPLVLDPVVLVYCGYIGGNDQDGGWSIAVDVQGSVYVTGYTYSSETSFPVAVGPDLTFNGMVDVFVAKVDPEGTGLHYCGYIGGDSEDWVDTVAVDSQGNAYISGWTYSDESSLPVTVGPDLTFNGGTQDAFVAKVNSQGTGLDYCGYIGGNDEEYGVGIAVDSQGNAYVSGWTYSDEASFPVTVGPDLTHNGLSDAFMAKVNVQGSGFDYCGYIGGNLYDSAYRIAVDNQGNAHLAGSSCSDEATFPVTVGPDLTYNGGDCDAFVARVNAQGTGLDYCGYIGGSDSDHGGGIAVDSQGNTYVMGYTSSDETSFPVNVGPDLTHNGGGWDGFVARVKPGGTGLDYCGYIGGNNYEYIVGIAVDNQGSAYVAGYTGSNEATFPVTIGPRVSHR